MILLLAKIVMGVISIAGLAALIFAAMIYFTADNDDARAMYVLPGILGLVILGLDLILYILVSLL